jgi:antitoxin component YwqK of YwqJK toxin-antitoxin module
MERTYYKDGKEHGRSTLWSETGDKIGTLIYKDGELIEED